MLTGGSRQVLGCQVCYSERLGLSLKQGSGTKLTRTYSGTSIPLSIVTALSRAVITFYGSADGPV